jgi:superfamily I DNA/RNA helicase
MTSPYIVELAARFIPECEQRTAFIKQNKVPPTEKETPLLYVADNFTDERARLIEVVKTRQARGEKIAILLPDNRRVFGFAKGLTEAGLEVEVRREGWRRNSPFPALNFSSDLPKVITYHSAKGLTFDAVLLPRLVHGFLPRATIPYTNLLFVGATRATQWVFLSTEQGKALLDMAQLRALAQEGKLTIQTPRDRFGRPTPARPEVKSPPLQDEEGIGDLL